MTCDGCIYHNPGNEGSTNIAPQAGRCRRYAPRKKHIEGEYSPLEDVLYRQIDNLEAMLCRILNRMPS